MVTFYLEPRNLFIQIEDGINLSVIRRGLKFGTLSGSWILPMCICMDLLLFQNEIICKLSISCGKLWHFGGSSQILFVAILLAELYNCAFFIFFFPFYKKKKKKSLPSRLIADGVTKMGSFAQGSIFLGTWIGRLNELCWCQQGTNFSFKSWSFNILNNNKNWSWCTAQTVHVVWLYSISYLWHDI